MLTAEILHRLEGLKADASQMLPSGCTGSGEPLRRRVAIVNGHRVTVLGIGHGEPRIVFEVDHSTEPLTLAQAAEAVA